MKSGVVPFDGMGQMKSYDTVLTKIVFFFFLNLIQFNLIDCISSNIFLCY